MSWIVKTVFGFGAAAARRIGMAPTWAVIAAAALLVVLLIAARVWRRVR